MERTLFRHDLLACIFAFCITSAVAEAREVRGTAYVRDADTVVVTGTAVRLNGVDAPETSNRYGREAKSEALSGINTALPYFLLALTTALP